MDKYTKNADVRESCFVNNQCSGNFYITNFYKSTKRTFYLSWDSIITSVSRETRLQNLQISIARISFHGRYGRCQHQRNDLRCYCLTITHLKPMAVPAPNTLMEASSHVFRIKIIDSKVFLVSMVVLIIMFLFPLQSTVNYLFRMILMKILLPNAVIIIPTQSSFSEEESKSESNRSEDEDYINL